jgi:Mg2+-importing ATPase
VPFFRSRPSLPLALAAIAVVLVGAVLPISPLGPVLGFRTLPFTFYAALAAMVVLYLVLIEFAKHVFYRFDTAGRQVPPPKPLRRLRRRTAAFSSARPRGPLGPMPLSLGFG